MSVLQILHYPDYRLRQIAKPVTKISNAILSLIDDMVETMYAEDGIGLAATQVNIPLQVIVIDISQQHNNCLVIINPKIVEHNGKTGIDEGCLSIPDQYSFIPRAKTIKIVALDKTGNNFELEAKDLLAICIQHEIDHLIGKLFIDYLSPLKRQIILKKIGKRKKELKQK